MLTGRDRLEVVEACLRNATNRVAVDHSFDVLGGSAGLLAVAAEIARHMPVSYTTLNTLVDTVLTHLSSQALYAAPDAIAWPSDGLDGTWLGGFGHGVAGIAWSLEQAAPSDPRSNRLAAGAWQAQDGLHTANGPWRDRRYPEAETVMNAWCHGAVGIGMAAADLFMMSGSKQHQRRAKAAGEAANDARGRLGDDSICHGTAGLLGFVINLDILQSDLIDRPLLENMKGTLAQRLVQAVMNTRYKSGLPSGVTAPGLMLGTAGIGHTLLRLVMRGDACDPQLLRLPMTPTLRHGDRCGPLCHRAS